MDAVSYHYDRDDESKPSRNHVIKNKIGKIGLVAVISNFHLYFTA